MRRERRATVVIAGAALLLGGGLTPGASAQTAATTRHTVVATGLDNPRGVDVGPNGTVFVAESGAGGTTLVQAQIEGEPSPVCVGNTGGVTAVLGDVQLRITTLPSFASAVEGPGGTPGCAGTGAEAVGPSDIAVGGGRVAVTMGLGGNVAVRDQLPASVRSLFGTVRAVRGGETTQLADLAAYEEVNNPVGEVDSNPYGLAWLPGRGYLATDAGGNDLLAVTTAGKATPTVTTVAGFPDLPARPFVPPSCASQAPPGSFPPAGTPIPPQAVPTTVEAGTNGTYYVGFLTGFPFFQGAARILRVSPSGRTSVFASGLTHVVGLDLAPDGALYAVELSTTSLLESFCGTPVTGDVVRFSRGRRTVVATGLPEPGGVAVAPDGSFYVSVNSTSAGEGELWRFAKPTR
ncbi:MAG: hypothetical protein JWN08_3054 [Frankiales bacterium]|nr:hypothetical protein [Frankiales bacterium]